MSKAIIPEIVTDAEVEEALRKQLEEYAASQPPAAPGAVNWMALLTLLRMILPLVVPAETLAEIREWVRKLFPV